MPKYLGYAHFVEFPPGSGTMYERGQNIPNMKKAEIRTMVAQGHSFEGVELETDDDDENRLPPPPTLLVTAPIGGSSTPQAGPQDVHVVRPDPPKPAPIPAPTLKKGT